MSQKLVLLPAREVFSTKVGFIPLEVCGTKGCFQRRDTVGFFFFFFFLVSAEVITRHSSVECEGREQKKDM